MKKLVLTLLFIISFMAAHAMTLKYLIVWKEIYSWDKSVKSLQVIPIEGSLEGNTLTLQMVEKNSEVFNIKVKNSTGNIVFQNEVLLSPKDCYKLDMNGYSKGIYQITVSNKDLVIEGDFSL